MTLILYYLCSYICNINNKYLENKCRQYYSWFSRILRMNFVLHEEGPKHSEQYWKINKVFWFISWKIFYLNFWRLSWKSSFFVKVIFVTKIQMIWRKYFLEAFSAFVITNICRCIFLLAVIFVWCLCWQLRLLLHQSPLPVHLEPLIVGQISWCWVGSMFLFLMLPDMILHLPPRHLWNKVMVFTGMKLWRLQNMHFLWRHVIIFYPPSTLRPMIFIGLLHFIMMKNGVWRKDIRLMIDQRHKNDDENMKHYWDCSSWWRTWLLLTVPVD